MQRKPLQQDWQNLPLAQTMVILQHLFGLLYYTQAAAEITSLQVQSLIYSLGRDDKRNLRTAVIRSQESKHYDANCKQYERFNQ